uniref:DHFR domain-containing protein n=1 Tax=Chenopodium quinoa TaxID=63459 RepID=A0A803LJK0_CHEQI
MGRKTWESIPRKNRPLPGRLNVVLTHSRDYDVGSLEDAVTCARINSALELLGMRPYDLLIERVFVIGGGQILREALNAPACDAIHITEIETDIECDTFMPPVDNSLFQPWYSSFLSVENNIRHSFVTYVRVRRTATDIGTQINTTKALSSKFEVHDFSFLPQMVFDRHQEHLYLKLVQEVLSSGNLKDDRIGMGTLSKFGCQVLQEKGIHIWDGNASRIYLDLIPGDFIHVIGDTHVYRNHIEPLQEQLQNLPKPFPINTQKKNIDSFVATDFELVGYDPH